MHGMTEEDINHIFAYHKPYGDQVTRFVAVRASALQLARFILTCTPSSPEQTLAIRKVQEAVMWSNAAIALNEAREKPNQVAPPEIGDDWPDAPESKET